MSVTLLTNMFTTYGSGSIRGFSGRICVGNSTVADAILLGGAISSARNSFQVSVTHPRSRSVAVTLGTSPSLMTACGTACCSATRTLPRGCCAMRAPRTAVLTNTIVSSSVAIDFGGLARLSHRGMCMLPIAMSRTDVKILGDSNAVCCILGNTTLVGAIPSVAGGLICMA